MPENSLRRLRRAAGYSSARAFAESVGLPPTTYVRYEQEDDGPETSMPIKNAWAIADGLGCSIDALVGREHLEDEAVADDMQVFYNRLSDENKARMREFCDYLDFSERRAAERERARLDAEFARMAANLEAAMEEDSTDAEGNNPLLFMTSGQRRDAFEEFVNARGAAMAIADEAEQAAVIDYAARISRGLVEAGGDGQPKLAAGTDGQEAEIREEVERNLAPWRERRQADDKVMIENILAAYDRLHPQTSL